MARKATYLELEETAEVVVDRTAAVFGPALNVRPRPVADLEGAKPAAAILPIYLREMGSTPLIDEHQEVALARELQEAREDMAKLARRIPAALRPHLLGVDVAGPKRGREWPLDNMEAFYARLIRHHRTDAKIAKLVREAKGFKRHVDHARDALILANLRLVVHIAKKYLNHGISFMDLIQEGNIGLMKAVEKFEYQRGYKFSTYATWWIRQAITRAIADQARTIRIPVHMIETMNKLVRAQRYLVQKLGREPSPEEVAEKMELSLEKVQMVLKIAKEPISLETPIGEDDDSHLGDFLEDKKRLSLTDEVIQRNLAEQTRRVLSTLTPREERVLKMRFGIGERSNHTLEEVGQDFAVTRERIRQIEAKALRKLRHASRARVLRAFME